MSDSSSTLAVRMYRLHINDRSKKGQKKVDYMILYGLKPYKDTTFNRN